MNKNRFTSLILDWYNENKRDLPWRKTKDPYKIWLSEIMLQQTRVSQGLPYYKKFLKNFSSVRELAQAPEKTVLRLWQGLGYYSRARNLHQCAKIISSQFNGKFPNTYESLLALPGIGEYTAAAISSIAFGQNQAVVDGNVFRVLSRIHGIDLDVGSPAGKKYFFKLANSIIPKQDPGLFNQSIMEFGALHCMPRNPKCGECVFSTHCNAFRTERQHMLPFKSKMKQRRRRHFNYFVIRAGNKIWMRPRTEKDVWRDLFEFFMIESPRPLSAENAIEQFKQATGLRSAKFSKKATPIKQVLSHQEIFGKFFDVELGVSQSPPLPNGKFYLVKGIERLAKPALITHYIREFG